MLASTVEIRNGQSRSTLKSRGASRYRWGCLADRAVSGTSIQVD